MYYRDHYFRLALYIVLLIAFSGAFFLLVHPWSWYSLLPISGIVWVIYRVVNLYNRFPREMSYFLNAIENEDSTLFFPENIGHQPTKVMHESLNRVNRLIQEVKLRNREQEQYYGMLLEQVATGIVVMNNKGSILLANNAAKELLNYPYLAHVEQLKRVDMALYRAFVSLLQESNHQFVKVSREESSTQLSLQATTFANHDNALRVISIHDISNELDAKEIESWQKLIRVLTHEIMNSITPITSLSETLLKYYVPAENPVSAEKTTEDSSTMGVGTSVFLANENEVGDNRATKEEELRLANEKRVANTVKGLEVINERGVGLIRFVESYRKLTRLSPPVLKPIVLKDLMEHLLVLLGNEPGFHRTRFRLEVSPTDMRVEADEGQLSQALINLVKNAMQAVENIANPEILISASRSSTGHSEIKITDNGPGIPPEIMDQVFIPFFTTKETGSGIGLSLTRQIIRNHGGTIEVASSPGNTRFTLKFIQ